MPDSSQAKDTSKKGIFDFSGMVQAYILYGAVGILLLMIIFSRKNA